MKKITDLKADYSTLAIGDNITFGAVLSVQFEDKDNIKIFTSFVYALNNIEQVEFIKTKSPEARFLNKGDVSFVAKGIETREIRDALEADIDVYKGFLWKQLDSVVIDFRDLSLEEQTLIIKSGDFNDVKKNILKQKKLMGMV